VNGLPQRTKWNFKEIVSGQQLESMMFTREEKKYSFIGT